MSEIKELQIPFCIGIKDLSIEQVLNIEELLKDKGISIGQPVTEYNKRMYIYYGVDYFGHTAFYDNRRSYSDDCEEEDVTLYSYDELVAILKPPVEDNPWMEWKGGECPVPIGTMVEVKYRDGEIAIVTAGLQSWDSGFKRICGGRTAVDWDIKDRKADIVAYRLYKPTESTEAKGDTQVLDSIKSVSEVIVEPLKTIKEDGVILNLSLDITLGGNTYTATRDEAFKLYEDLKTIFGEKIV